MAQRTTLNDVQVEVLRWISEGCRDGVVADGVSARISAAALRNRGLVRTSGHGPSWKAKITAAGTEYLQQVDGPHPPLPRQPPLPRTMKPFGADRHRRWAGTWFVEAVAAHARPRFWDSLVVPMGVAKWGERRGGAITASMVKYGASETSNKSNLDEAFFFFFFLIDKR
jgi:hypothetical protein